jgi:metal-sulfur cluster biosynthetic enzyme
MVTDGDILEALRTVLDPELGINIVDLGLVYQVDVDEAGVRIALTMTSPACPLQEFIKAQVLEALETAGLTAGDVEIDFVMDPPWTAERMSDEARRQLGDR